MLAPSVSLASVHRIQEIFLLWYDKSWGIALTFASPTGKLSIRPSNAFGQRDEPGVNVESAAKADSGNVRSY
jgi:hypothetical protein